MARRSTFYSFDPQEFWNMVDRSQDGCWPWTGASRWDGYGRVRLDGKIMTSSRAAWILSHDDPGDLFVLHDCHNRICANPAHLHLGTNAMNMQEMAQAGRAYKAFGEDNTTARLTTEQVLAIRADSRRSKEIEAEYGIGNSTVSQIRSGKRWAHLGPTERVRRPRAKDSRLSKTDALSAAPTATNTTANGVDGNE